MPSPWRVAFGLFALAPAAAAEPPAPGTIVGDVTVRHPREVAPIPVPRQQEVCGRSVPDDAIVIDRRGALSGVVVWIEGLSRPAQLSPAPADIDQQGCRFVPRVQSVTAGAAFSIRSQDPILHTVHALLGSTRTLFNVAIPIAGMTIRKRLTEPGTVRFRCDVGHTWMTAWALVFDHPYHAVTGPDGTFRIAAVPPGTHRVRFWHERMGEATTTAAVLPAGVVRVRLRY